MGYITIFGQELEAKLTGLPVEQRREVVAFVKEQVLQSYRNGLRDGADGKAAPEKKRGDITSK